MTKTNESTLSKLNEFYRGEKSAVETYELAIKSVKDPELNNTLKQLCHSHAERVDTIQKKIQELGGKVDEGSGAWGAFAKIVQGGADLLGDSSAVSALEEGEDHGIKTYADAMKEDDAFIREFASSSMMPMQKKSHDICRSLKRFVKAAST